MKKEIIYLVTSLLLVSFAFGAFQVTNEGFVDEGAPTGENTQLVEEESTDEEDSITPPKGCITGTGVEVDNGEERCACKSTALFLCSDGNWEQIRAAGIVESCIANQISHCNIEEETISIGNVLAYNFGYDYWNEDKDYRDNIDDEAFEVEYYTYEDNILRATEKIGEDGRVCQEITRPNGNKYGDCSNPQTYVFLKNIPSWNFVYDSENTPIWYKLDRIALNKNLNAGGEFKAYFYDPISNETVKDITIIKPNEYLTTNIDIERGEPGESCKEWLERNNVEYSSVYAALSSVFGIEIFDNYCAYVETNLRNEEIVEDCIPKRATWFDTLDGDENSSHAMLAYPTSICTNNFGDGSIDTVTTNIKKANNNTAIPEGFIGIENCRQLQAIEENPDGNYILEDQIDCSESRLYNNGTGFEPISEFSGILDGNFYEIRNLYINRENDSGMGLFNRLDFAEIRNLGLYNNFIVGEIAVGTLAGYVEDSLIDSIELADNELISKSGSVGGLVGSAERTSISNIDSSDTEINAEVGDLEGLDYGGLIGYSENNEIESIHIEDQNIYGDSYVGSLMGFSRNSYIKDISIESFTQGKDLIGHIAGELRTSTVDDVDIHLDVFGDNYVGLLAGLAQDSDFNNIDIDDSYVNSEHEDRGFYIGLLFGRDKMVEVREIYGNEIKYFGEDKFFNVISSWSEESNFEDVDLDDVYVKDEYLNPNKYTSQIIRNNDETILENVFVNGYDVNNLTEEVDNPTASSCQIQKIEFVKRGFNEFYNESRYVYKFTTNNFLGENKVGRTVKHYLSDYSMKVNFGFTGLGYEVFNETIEFTGPNYATILERELEFMDKVKNNLNIYIESNDGFIEYCSMPEEDELNENVCHDSDDGNLQEKGSTYAFEYKTNEISEKRDYCTSPYILKEFSCSAENVRANFVECNCHNGECISDLETDQLEYYTLNLFHGDITESRYDILVVFEDLSKTNIYYYLNLGFGSGEHSFFKTDVIKDNKDLFNVWYTVIPVIADYGDTPNCEWGAGWSTKAEFIATSENNIPGYNNFDNVVNIAQDPSLWPHANRGLYSNMGINCGDNGRGAGFAGTLTHELAHSIGELSDEYLFSSTFKNNDKNCKYPISDPKWNDILGWDGDHFEGCGGEPSYRGTQDSLMRTSWLYSLPEDDSQYDANKTWGDVWGPINEYYWNQKLDEIRGAE